MASGYEMTGPLWGVGKYVPEFGAEGENVVFLVGANRVVLSPAKQEEFAQLYVAACHQAKANAEAVAGAVTPGQVAQAAGTEADHG